MTRRSKAAFETTDVRALRVLAFAAAVTVGLVLSFAFVAWLLHVSNPEPSKGRSEIKEGVRLEVDPVSERRRLQEKATARLAGYGWIDAPAGRAHIPIERAMALLAERGWPDAAAAAQKEGRR